METSEEAEALLRGQAEVWKYMFAFADSMALKSAVELRIPDIMHSHGAPITLSQIASSIASTPPPTQPNIPYLARIMRLLVRRKIFTVDRPSDVGGEPKYGLTHVSRWLLRDSDWSLAPMLLMQNHPLMMAPWHCLAQCVREGGVAFEKAHGRDIWKMASEDPEMNGLFNNGMACATKVVTRGIILGYGDGFRRIGSMVDLGGGTGFMAAEIVRSYPHVKLINFDLPHVVATAPEFDGVAHVAGNMFEAIPSADAVFMKWVMHDWGDEDCVKILKNCKKAIPEKTGKVIIVDIVLQPDGSGPLDDSGIVFDLLMIAHSSGGKERTELEWSRVLKEGGFPRYNIIDIPAFPSIIEAYPDVE